MDSSGCLSSRVNCLSERVRGGHRLSERVRRGHRLTSWCWYRGRHAVQMARPSQFCHLGSAVASECVGARCFPRSQRRGVGGLTVLHPQRHAWPSDKGITLVRNTYRPRFGQIGTMTRERLNALYTAVSSRDVHGRGATLRDNNRSTRLVTAGHQRTRPCTHRVCNLDVRPMPHQLVDAPRAAAGSCSIRRAFAVLSYQSPVTTAPHHE